MESIQPGNLAQCKVSEDVLPEFQRFSRSFNGMIDRLDAGFTAQRAVYWATLRTSCARRLR